MIDLARLRAVVDSLASPNLPNLPTPPKEELGRPEARNGKASPNVPNLPNLETEENATRPGTGEPEAPAPEECLFSFSIKKNLGRLGKLGEPRAAKGYSRPTYPPDNLGSLENLGSTSEEEPWTCPLGHRAHWISAHGLKICSTCHPKPERKAP